VPQTNVGVFPVAKENKHVSCIIAIITKFSVAITKKIDEIDNK